jgi:sterol desaturase/sphingolipid hydroxylase (fatty acid hydroxylase superfamily)
MSSSQTDESTTKMASKANPKDSMKSTWRQSPKSGWTQAHWFFQHLGIHPTDLDKEIPVHPKTDKIPYTPEWHLLRWVFFHACLPLALHQLIVSYVGYNLSALQALLFYTLAFKAIAIHELHSLRRIAHKVGFLDGDVHERDGVPDVGVAKTVKSLLSTSIFRPVFTIFLSYRVSQTPAQMNWLWLPLEIGLYGIILDFWFYWYHRLMHEHPALWKYHRTHHLTKHPNPLLTLYADFEQEFFDIAGVPIATYLTMKAMGFPMGFYEWWIGHQFVVFAELAGHSGLRVHAEPPNPFTFLLRMFNCELVIEDHDMHHRQGWKTSGNYGKQTRLWDRIFGTCKERVENRAENIDWDHPVPMPLF